MKHFDVHVESTVRIIDRDIDVVDVISNTVKFVIIDPQIQVTLEPGVNSTTIAGRYCTWRES